METPSTSPRLSRRNASQSLGLYSSSGSLYHLKQRISGVKSSTQSLHCQNRHFQVLFGSSHLSSWSLDKKRSSLPSLGEETSLRQSGLSHSTVKPREINRKISFRPKRSSSQHRPSDWSFDPKHTSFHLASPPHCTICDEFEGLYLEDRKSRRFQPYIFRWSYLFLSSFSMNQSPTTLSPTSTNGNRIDVSKNLDSKVDPALLSYLIISGGTGANSIASAFGASPAFVLPVSDDGGSSSEILRCFGGPSIGDIRSRLIRLIPLPLGNPSNSEEEERQAIYNLLAYRFPAEAAEKVVRDLWLDIVEGRSELWNGIKEDKKECIRAFLVHFQTLCLRRAHKRFSFRNFSLGNGFLTGARDLFGSLPSAIFLFKSIAGVNSGVQVIPVINTNQTVTIAAQLANATTLVGQCTISHPTPPPTPSISAPPTPKITPLPSRQAGWNKHVPHLRRDSRTFDTDALSNALDDVEEEEWSGGNLGYRKGEGEIPLEARIERIFYINLYGQEIFPEPNTEFLDTIAKRDVLVYSCGSLWTSIIPSLALRGLATAIATSDSLKAKVLLLNATNDRETPGYTASEYVTAILGTLRHYDRPKKQHAHNFPLMPTVWDPKRLVTHVVYLEGAKVDLDPVAIKNMGIGLIGVPREVSGAKPGDTPLFSVETVEWAMEKVMSSLSG